MTVITVSSNPAISVWQSSTTNADRVVDGVTLSGMAAAAYHFGEALKTVKFQGLLDGVQLTDGRFEFPPESGQWVALAEVADALHYKYGVDPLIEFAPGLGLRGYSVVDINAILERLNHEFTGQFSLSLINSSAVQAQTQSDFATEKTAASSSATYDATAVTALLDTASTSQRAPATEAELRSDLTEGGDVYVDRRGGFYINGVPTTAKDLAVVSRLLAQDNIAAEYKVLMDEYTERNNLIAAARTVLDGGFNQLRQATTSLSQQYGIDVLSTLTAGQYSDAQSPVVASSMDLSNDTLQFAGDPGWASGKPVRVSADGGGLTAGVDYYIRSLGNGQYSLFTTHDSATGTGASHQVNLTGSITAPFVASEVRPAQAVTTTSSTGSFETTAASFAIRPSSTNWATNQIHFAQDPGWPNGTRVLLRDGAALDGQGTHLGGLELNTFYYARNDGGGSYTLFAKSTLGGVFNSTPPIDLVQSGTEETIDVGFIWGDPLGGQSGPDEPAFQGWRGWSEFKLPSSLQPGDHWATGTAIQVADDVTVNLFEFYDLYDQVLNTGYAGYGPGEITALKKNTNYYLRSLGSDNYSIYDTEAHALAGGPVGRMYFYLEDLEDPSRSVSSRIGLNETSILIMGENAVHLSLDPKWSDGTAVQTRATGGGLNAGTTYYARNRGEGNYSFYTSEAAAVAGDASGQVALTDGHVFSGDLFEYPLPMTASDFSGLSALLNTLISNKVRDGDLDQAKLQTLTAQLQNNTEAMTAMIKVFSDLNATLLQSLR